MPRYLEIPGDSGMWNLVESVLFYGFILFFGSCTFPVCRPSGSTCVFVFLSLFSSYVFRFCFETRVPMFCYLSHWISPKEHFWDGDILHSVGRVEDFNYALSSQEVGVKQMAVMLEPSGISHLIEEILAWDFLGVQLIGKFTQKRHWVTSWSLLLLWGKSLPLSPFLLPCLALAHTWMVLWGTVTNRVMVYWPDPHFFIL